MFLNGQNESVLHNFQLDFRAGDSCCAVGNGADPPDFTISKVNVEEANLWYDIFKAEAIRRNAATTITVAIIEKRCGLKPGALASYRANCLSRKGFFGDKYKHLKKKKEG
jgi:hypothetical protein